MIFSQAPMPIDLIAGLTMLQKRIADKHLLALIGKWLNVGVIEEGQLLLSENGTYQGSVISPVLANLYLHGVLDSWFEKEVRPRMRGGRGGSATLSVC